MENQTVENCNNQVSKVFVTSTDRKCRMKLIRLSSMYAAPHVFMICLRNENELSKIIHKFLSDLLNSIGMSLTFKVEGKA